MWRGRRGGHHDVDSYLFFAVHQLHGVCLLASGFALFSCHSFSFFSLLVAFFFSSCSSCGFCCSLSVSVRTCCWSPRRTSFFLKGCGVVVNSPTPVDAGMLVAAAGNGTVVEGRAGWMSEAGAPSVAVNQSRGRCQGIRVQERIHALCKRLSQWEPSETNVFYSAGVRGEVHSTRVPDSSNLLSQGQTTA